MASPTSLKITLHQLKLGAECSLAECLQMEYRVGNRILKHREFHEGKYTFTHHTKFAN